MWEDDHAVLITQVTKADELICWLAAGRKEQVLELSRDAYWWAARKGIRRAHFTGRRGWAREPGIIEDGWVVRAAHLTKELDNGQGQ